MTTVDREGGPPGDAAVRRRAGRGVLRYTLAASVLALVLFLAGITLIGFPPFLADRLLAAANRGPWFFEVSRLTLDPRGGIAAHEPRMYRKGVAGPACFEAKRVYVRFAPQELVRRGRFRVREVVVDQGLVRPWRRVSSAPAGKPAGPGTAEAPAAAPDMDIVVRLEDARIAGVPVRKARGRVIRQNGGYRVADVEVRVGDDLHAGTLQGDVARDAGGRISGRLTARMDPHLVLPLLEEAGLEASAVVERFSFHGEPPLVEATFEMPAGEEGAVTFRGRFQAAEFAYLGAGIGFANISWQYEGGGERRRLALNPLVLVVRGQSVTGWVDLDLAREWVTGEVVSMAELPMVARMVGAPRGWIPEGWTFGGPVRLYAKGKFGYGDGAAATDMEVAVEGKNARMGRFQAEELSLKWVMKGPSHELADVRARTAGGSVTGWAAFTPDAAAPSGFRYRLCGEILNAELPRVLGMLQAGPERPLEGRLYGSVELEGPMEKGKAQGGVTGRGRVSITGGRLFTLPLFGGLSEALASRFPGMDMLLTQRDARATFEIVDGGIRTGDARIEGDLFSVEGEGRYGLDGTLRFTVKVRPATERKGIAPAVRALTLPLSKLLEFKLEGTLSKPVWKSAALSWPAWMNNDSKKAKEP